MAQTPPAMSAEEINRRLETPITYRTDPVRLPVALDDIGSLVGVRIRCEQELQPAVIVAGCKNRPAKELVKHLIDGIGAGSFISNGTLHIGLRVVTEQQAEKQRELELKAIKSYLDGRAKQMKIDEPLDAALPSRTASQVMLTLQFNGYGNGEYRVPYYGSYGAGRQSPPYRATVALLRAIGPELLQTADDRPKVITPRELKPEQMAKVQEAFDQLAKEQAVWSEPFKPVFKAVSNSQYAGYVDEDLLAKSVSIAGTKPDSFRLLITPSAWGRSVTIEISSGGEMLFETYESLPKQRVYTDPGGESFQVQKASGIMVPLSEKVQRLEAYRMPDKENKPKVYDWNLVKQIADPWRNEPLAYTRAQPMADVLLKMDLNFATYLGDQLMYQISYNYYNDTPKEVRGDQVLGLVNYGTISGLRKKGDWVVGYCSNPEVYLDTQVNRNALGKFLNLAIRPGALSFEQHLASRKELGQNQMTLARQVARLVRPGFESLNPVNLDLLESISKVSPGMLSQMKSQGVPLANLPSDVQKRIMGYIGYQRRANNAYYPTESIDSPPTLQEIRQSRLFLDQTSAQGFISLDGNSTALAFSAYAYYSFQPMEQFRNFSSPEQVAVNYGSRRTWLARMDSLQFRLDVKRKRTQVFGTMQYVTDVAATPLTTGQLVQAIQRYFSER